MEHRRVRAEAAPQEHAQPVGDLGRLRPGKRGDDPPAGAPQQLLRTVQGGVPLERLEPELAPAERRRHPIRRMQVREREAALVADPAAVDLGVVARLHALDLTFARRRADVAAGGAEPADGRHVLDLPGAGLEAVLGRRQRAHRAQLDHVAGERRAVRILAERRDLGVRPAVPRDQLAVLGDVAREAGAAVAEDAALAVERDQRRHRDRLVERHLRERHPGRAGAVPEREVLQRALAALVADRAVERVVDEDELERALLAVGCALRARRRSHDHPFLGGERAARLELREPLDLDEAHAARADGGPEARLVAEDRDLDPRRSRRLDEARSLLDLDLPVVDHDRDQLAHAAALLAPPALAARRCLDASGFSQHICSSRSAHATTASGRWISAGPTCAACTSVGATMPSSDEAPSNGHAPCSTCARNSSRNFAR